MSQVHLWHVGLWGSVQTTCAEVNPFATRCQYTDTLFQLEIAALSIQIHGLTDDVVMF